MARGIHRFGDFTLDMDRRLLCLKAQPVALGPRVVETLVALVARPGELVTKAELMDEIWPERDVEEGNITQNVHRLRRVLAAGGLTRAIETMPARGYRFVAPLEPRPRHSEITSRHGARLCAAFMALIAVLTLCDWWSHSATAPEHLSPESQRLYALGRYHWNLRPERAHLREAIADFREVTRRDPKSPLGYSGLADAYLARFDDECDSNPKNCLLTAGLVGSNARMAVELDPASVEAHTSLAMAIYVLGGDFARSDAEFKRAIALDDRYALAHHWYGNSLLVRGLFAQALAEQHTALALEPASSATYTWLAEEAFFSRHYADAIAYARQSSALVPGWNQTWRILGLSYELSGDRAAALGVYRRFGTVRRAALTAALYARAGDRARAAAILRSLSPAEVQADGDTLDVALAHIAAGDTAGGYALMRKTRLPSLTARNFLALDPRLDAVRRDPRFRLWTQAPNAVSLF